MVARVCSWLMMWRMVARERARSVSWGVEKEMVVEVGQVVRVQGGSRAKK